MRNLTEQQRKDRDVRAEERHAAARERLTGNEQPRPLAEAAKSKPKAEAVEPKPKKGWR